MPAVVGASLSETNAPPSELWLGCITHHLNTAMKHTCRHLSLFNAAPALTDIHTDLSAVKAIVTFMKHAGRNYLLSEGYSLLQESRPRFGKTFDVVQRFIKSAYLVEPHLSPAMKSLCSGLRVEASPTGTYYPALMDIVECFRPPRSMQNSLETSRNVSIHAVLTVYIARRKMLLHLHMGFPASPEQTMSQFEIALSAIVLSEIQAIAVRRLWTAACILHAGLRGFQLVMDKVERSKLYHNGINLLLSMF